MWRTLNQDDFRYLGAVAIRREDSKSPLLSGLEEKKIRYRLGAGGVGFQELWCSPDDFSAALTFLQAEFWEHRDFFNGGEDTGLTHADFLLRHRKKAEDSASSSEGSL